MTILCGTDLTPASAAAFDVALAIARKRGDREVVLVYAADPDSGGVDAAREPALDAARVQLDAMIAERRPAGGPAVRGEVLVGVPDEALMHLADTEGADLIVINARSADTTLLRLGTTTSKIIARSHVPVLIVRDPAPWLAFARGERPLRVLIGVDDSAACERGIQWTQGLRTTGPLEVILGAVYYPDDAAEKYGLGRGAMVDRAPELETLLERDLLRRFNSVHGAADAGVSARTIRGLGRIGDHMIELAAEATIDVVVVGTNQKTGLGRLGSVSSVIANDAPQSVVCVPPQARVMASALPPLRSALVATDLSDRSNRAIPYAFSIVGGATGGGVHILYVADKDAELDESKLRAQLGALRPPGTTATVSLHIVRAENVPTAIIQAGARIGVDVIVVASSGRSAIARAFDRSVSGRVAREAKQPVLVLPPL